MTYVFMTGIFRSGREEETSVGGGGGGRSARSECQGPAGGVPGRAQPGNASVAR